MLSAFGVGRFFFLPMKSKSDLPFLPLVALLLVSLPITTLPGETNSPAKERRVVLIVWDGMRPDFVSERNTPALWKLAREGVFFRHHHSVYITSTDVNGAALATGVYPNRSGLLANREYRPPINAQNAIDTGEDNNIRKGDEVSNGSYLALPTIAELVRSAGRKAAIVGTKSVVLLHDRHAEWTTAIAKERSFPIFAGAPMPPALRDETQRLLGPFLVGPEDSSAQRNEFATRALTDILWREGIPAFSLLWLSEPDLSQHETSPGSETSLAAIRNSDNNLAAVLEALGKKKARETTDILVVSDHGFSTVGRTVDFPAALCAEGFDTVTGFTEAPRAGQVMIVGNGGTILFYVIEHDRVVTARLVEWLQRSDSAGVIFTREKFEGTFALETVHANTADAPDVMVALRWNDKPNSFGISGTIGDNETLNSVKGSHATLSTFDVHNTLIAAGPDFRRGMTDDLATGNIDIAPTILHLLGLHAPGKLDGRVLFEALSRNNKEPARTGHETLEASRAFGDHIWRQHLKLSRVGPVTYVDEGNGALAPAPSP